MGFFDREIRGATAGRIAAPLFMIFETGVPSCYGTHVVRSVEGTQEEHAFSACPEAPNTGTQSLLGEEKGWNATVRSSRRTCGSTLLKALPAIDGTPLSRLEGNSGLFTTLRTDRAGFHTPMALPIEQLRSLGLTRFTALRLVLKPLVREKELLASRENEFRSAVDALEDPIPVFHD